jgi:hypothetical protein
MVSRHGMSHAAGTWILRNCSSSGTFVARGRRLAGPAAGGPQSKTLERLATAVGVKVMAWAHEQGAPPASGAHRA